MKEIDHYLCERCEAEFQDTTPPVCPRCGEDERIVEVEDPDSE